MDRYYYNATLEKPMREVASTGNFPTTYELAAVGGLTCTQLQVSCRYPISPFFIESVPEFLVYSPPASVSVISHLLTAIPPDMTCLR